MKLDDLIAACVAAPDDDEPRLVWADAVGGERGELVVVQCKLARGDVTPMESGLLRLRQRELLALQRPEWSGLSGIASKVRWRRGFVEAAAIDAVRFVDEADDIFRRAPLLRSLTATGLRSRQEMHESDVEPVALPRLTKLFKSAALKRLGGLFIYEANQRVEIDIAQYLNQIDVHMSYFLEPALEIAKRLGALGHLHAFGSKASGPANVRSVLDNVQRYWHHEDNLVDARHLVTSLPSLVALDVDGNDIRPSIAHLPTKLRELRSRFFAGRAIDDSLVELARRCPALERLAIEDSMLASAEVLGGFRNVRSLKLTDTYVRDVAIDVPPLPALRELGAFRELTHDAARRLVDRFGSQLDVLDLSESGLIESFDKFSGDIVIYPKHPEYEPLMLADDHAPEPWWERTTVTP